MLTLYNILKNSRSLTFVRVCLSDLHFCVSRFRLVRRGHTVLVVRLCSTTQQQTLKSNLTNYCESNSVILSDIQRTTAIF